jgi:hypothetical protein
VDYHNLCGGLYQVLIWWVAVQHESLTTLEGSATTNVYDSHSIVLLFLVIQSFDRHSVIIRSRQFLYGSKLKIFTDRSISYSSRRFQYNIMQVSELYLTVN